MAATYHEQFEQLPRGHHSPFPRSKGQSLSYWLQQVGDDGLSRHNSTTPLPSEADCVVIGSGMTGCLAAKHYQETFPRSSVVVLEARDFCSGATGRNAGHCKPYHHRGFDAYQKALGTEQAIKVLKNEQTTFEALCTYIRDNEVDCDFWCGNTLDVATTPGAAFLTQERLARYQAAGGCVEHITITSDPLEAQKLSRLKNATACWSWPAATLQPRKLAAHIMRGNLKNGVSLYTHTEVRHVIRSEQTAASWRVCTSRGEITCATVIHATNAYASACEPLFQDLIYAYPHICNKISPPSTFSGPTKALQNSYGVLLPNDSYFSINARSNSDQVMLIGGECKAQLALKSWIDRESPDCRNDDGIMNVKAIDDEVREFVEENFIGWKKEQDVTKISSWSGVIGLTKDEVPFVGEIPGKPGQWACVAFNGHGMASIWTVVPALVKLMRGFAWDDIDLPEAFRLTQERAARLKEQMVRAGANGAH